MDFGTIVGLALVVLVVIVITKGFVIIRQSECMIIERFGRYHRTLSGGLNLIIPIYENAREMYWASGEYVDFIKRIDLRETVLDVAQQTVITKDNVSISIDALLYIQVIDPAKAIYEIANLPMAVGQLAQTSLRNVIGDMELDETLSSRDVINSKLKAILDDATDKWGTKVNRVEIKNITPPREIQMAMEKQMQAERERRAKVLEADGDRQARITRSEGVKQEQINLSEGDKESQVRHAQGEASAIREVAEAKREALEKIKSVLGSSDLTTQFVLSSSYLEQFGNFTQKPGDKVYVPYEASATIAGIGALKELLERKMQAPTK